MSIDLLERLRVLRHGDAPRVVNVERLVGETIATNVFAVHIGVCGFKSFDVVNSGYPVWGDEGMQLAITPQAEHVLAKAGMRRLSSGNVAPFAHPALPPDHRLYMTRLQEVDGACIYWRERGSYALLVRFDVGGLDALLRNRGVPLGLRAQQLRADNGYLSATRVKIIGGPELRADSTKDHDPDRKTLLFQPVSPLSKLPGIDWFGRGLSAKDAVRFSIPLDVV